MGLVSNSVRLQTRIQQDSTVQWYKRNTGQCKKSRNYFRRGKFFIKKASYCSCSKETNKRRFLQYNFSCKEKERWFKTCHQPSTSQPVSQENSFQNGHSENSPRSCKKGRLCNKSRHERRVLPFTCTSVSPKVSEILFYGSGVSVHSSLFRSNISSSSFHENSGRSCSISSHFHHSDSNIPGRLVSTKSDAPWTAVEPTKSSGHNGRSGVYDKPHKIKSGPNSDHSVHRGVFTFEKGSSVSNTGESFGDQNIYMQNTKWSQHCSGLFTSAGIDSILSTVIPVCKAVYEADSVTSSETLEGKFRQSGETNSLFTFSFGSHELVVTQSQHSYRQIIQTGEKQFHTYNRCFTQGLGCSFEWPDCSRDLEQLPEFTAYKLSGTSSSSLCPETFSSTIEARECSDPLRQHNSCSVYKSPRGDKISSTVLSDMGFMADCYLEQYSSVSCAYSRSQEYFSRSFELIQGERDRVVSRLIGNSGNIHSVGRTNHRSFATYANRKTVVFCSWTPHPQAYAVDALSVPWEGMFAYAFPPIPLIPKVLNQTRLCRSCQVILIAPMWPRRHWYPQLLVTNCQTSTPTSNQVPPNSVSEESSASKPRDAAVDCMASIDRQFETKGFSAETRKLLAASWRAGTKKDYSGKFKKFRSWCAEREIDPYSISLTQVAEFLTCLFNQDLKYRTIAGYRSMLSSLVAPVDGKPVGQHPYIIRLLKGVFNSRPPTSRLLPEWDLPLVLQVLEECPFEPLAKAPLKLVTWKTVFLVAITTFRRCSDICSFMFGENNVNVQKHGVTFVRQGLSKQDRLNHVSSNIFIPAFTDSKLVDPKRALAIYLKRTEEFRHINGFEELKLFISYVKKHKAVTPQTISKWLVRTIKFAYRQRNKDLKVRGHSTRAVAPSWALYKGVSMKSIMNTADWAKESTFTRFYLRNTNVNFLQ